MADLSISSLEVLNADARRAVRSRRKRLAQQHRDGQRGTPAGGRMTYFDMPEMTYLWWQKTQ